MSTPWTKGGATPLSIAAELDYTDCVKILIESEARERTQKRRRVIQ
ncbi:hypothetical protein [Endozoicomonas sp. 8E]